MCSPFNPILLRQRITPSVASTAQTPAVEMILGREHYIYTFTHLHIYTLFHEPPPILHTHYHFYFRPRWGIDRREYTCIRKRRTGAADECKRWLRPSACR